MRLWIVCPCYRDVASFEILRTRILEELARQGFVSSDDVSFVVVDDTAGYDNDIDQLKGYSDVRVITPPFNLGHQRALVFGLRLMLPEVLESDLIVTMDSDGEDRPEDLARLAEPLLARPRRTWVALCRPPHEAQRVAPLPHPLRLFPHHVPHADRYDRAQRKLCRLSRAGWPQRMLTHPYFDLCYSSTLVSLDMTVTAVPCPRGKRYEGRSRMNMLRLFMHGVRMLMPFMDRIAVRALTVFSAMFGLGITFSLAVLGYPGLHQYRYPGMGDGDHSRPPDPLVHSPGELRRVVRRVLPLQGHLAGQPGALERPRDQWSRCLVGMHNRARQRGKNDG